MHNPYSKAADAYGTTAASTDQRMLEGQILLKAAQKLEDLAKRMGTGEAVPQDNISEVLTYNQKLWQLFVEDMMNPNHLLPQDIKNNVASLALYVFKRTHEILLDIGLHKPEVDKKFQVLVNINRNIASGLMKQAPAAPVRAPAAPSSEGRIATDSVA